MFRRSVALACALSIPLSPGLARAQTGSYDEPRAAPTTPSGTPAPREHFERALVQYRAGRYRDAIRWLREALALDPASKDLLFNLARVHEKLGELDEAIAWLERYIELEADPAEVERAREAIVRMRGARGEVTPVAPPPVAVAPPPAMLLEMPVAPRSPASASSEAWLFAGAGLTAAAALVGVVFGMRALVLQPDTSSGAVSTRDIERREQRARDSATVADIAFSVSLLAGASTALLWFGRGPDAPCNAATVSWATEF